MQNSPVVIASDHAGLHHKCILKVELAALGREAVDLGPNEETSVDYPDFAQALTHEIETGRAELGVLICGTGIGMSIAVNRSALIRGALCYGEEAARLARAHNDANVLVLGARLISEETARACLKTFLDTKFEGGRHARRVAKLS